MNEKEALGIIMLARHRAKVFGYLIWFSIILVGILGTIYWKWYAFIIAICVMLPVSAIYSVQMTKKVQRLTGLAIHEQDELLKKQDLILNLHEDY